MAPSLDLQASSLCQEDKLHELKQLHNLLHLFHHRNKNQHRRSIWWRSFESFRRELGRVLDEANQWVAATADLSKGTWSKGTKGLKARMALAQKNAARKPQIEAKLKQRLLWWADSLVEKWWIAFTHILTLNQFAQLGLFLVAALARCSRLTGLIAALEQLADAETEVLITRFADEETSEILGSTNTPNDEDVGEVVERHLGEGHDRVEDLTVVLPSSADNTDRTSQETLSVQVQSKEERPLSLPKQKRKLTSPVKFITKKKRRKVENAFDDLFKGTP